MSRPLPLLAALALLAPAAVGPVLSGASSGAGFAAASAQGLIWSLPADGTWVRHEGTYRQVDVNLRNEEREYTWRRHLTIRSVGSETLDYRDESVRCRVLEFEIETGTAGEGVLDPGAAGRMLYKVWVPETEITGQAVDRRGIPRSALPIAKGYVRTGEDEPVALRSDALRLYPTVTLLTDYDPSDLREEGGQPVDLPIGSVEATRYAAEQVLETPAARTTNRAVLFVSAAVPFGPAKWTVNLDRERKDASEERDRFRTASRITVEMEATATGTDAIAELDVR